MAHDVFISYAEEDKITADAVCATLETAGIRCWIAPRDVLPGEDYAAALVRAIEESSHLVLLLSSHSNESSHVKNEVERATDKNIPILPFRIEDVRPSRSMELFISRTQWLDAFTPPLERHLERLAETLKELLGRQEPVDPSLTRPKPPGPDGSALARRATAFAIGWAGSHRLLLALGLGVSGAIAVVIILVLLIFDGPENGSVVGETPPPGSTSPQGSPSPTIPPDAADADLAGTWTIIETLTSGTNSATPIGTMVMRSWIITTRDCPADPCRYTQMSLGSSAQLEITYEDGVLTYSGTADPDDCVDGTTLPGAYTVSVTGQAQVTKTENEDGTVTATEFTGTSDREGTSEDERCPTFMQSWSVSGSRAGGSGLR